MPSGERSQDLARSGVRFRLVSKETSPLYRSFIAGIVFGGRVVIAWIGAFAAGQEKRLVAVDPIDNRRGKTHPAHQGIDLTGMGIIAASIAHSSARKRRVLRK